jgi:hypothetical protein
MELTRSLMGNLANGTARTPAAINVPGTGQTHHQPRIPVTAERAST